MKRKLLISGLTLALAATFTAGAGLLTSASAEELQSHLIFSENFDGLTQETFAQKFENVSAEEIDEPILEEGGVNEGGKALKITGWSLASVDLPALKGLDSLTIAAWVRTDNSEERLFGVSSEGTQYYLKGGSIADAEHTVMAWSNEQGHAVFNHDDNREGIYSGSNGAREDYFHYTVTVERDGVRFYKNELLIDSYYTLYDSSAKDVQKFLDSFYDGLAAGKLLVGGGAFDEDYANEYYIDDIRVYDYAVQTYGDLYAVMSEGKDLLAEKYGAIVDGAAVPAASSERAPVLYYDFEDDFSNKTVKNRGTLSGGDATIVGDEFKQVEGRLSLNGGAYLKLPEHFFGKGVTDFSVSMDITRSTSRTFDAFYYFSENSFESNPDEDGVTFDFVDCWYQASERNMGTTPWLITDYCNNRKGESSSDAQWAFTMIKPTESEFNVTTVYKSNGSKGTLSIYVDGHLYHDVPIENGVVPGDFVYGYFGRGFWDRENFRGEFDNIAVYDYALEQQTVLDLANRLTVTVDLPANAQQGVDLAAHTYCDFRHYTEESYTLGEELLSGLQIDYAAKKTQTFKLSEGVNAVVYFRDIQNLSQSVTYKVNETLPETVKMSYSDGSEEELAVKWNKPYVFGGDASYTGSVTDKAGRTATVTYNVQYAAGKAELRELIDRARAVLDFEILYDEDMFAAYEEAVTATLEKAEGQIDSASDYLPIIKELYAAMTSVEEPLRSLDQKIYTVQLHFGGGDQERGRVSVVGSGTDTIILRNTFMSVEMYTASGYASIEEIPCTLTAGDYTVKIVRKLNGNMPTSIVNVYLYRGSELLATYEDGVSESVGDCTVDGASVADVSLLSFYTTVQAQRYTTDSMEAYNKIVSEKQIKKELKDWIMLTPAEIDAMTANAAEAYGKLEYTKIASVAPFADIKCKQGTDVNSLIPAIASVTYDNGRTASLRITWDKSNLDTSKGGEIVLSGTVEQYDGSLYTVNVKIIVEGDGSQQQQPSGGNEDEQGGGCGSVVGLASLPCLLLAATALFLKRKKDEQ